MTPTPPGTRALLDTTVLLEHLPGQHLQLDARRDRAFDVEVLAEGGEWVQIRTSGSSCYPGLFGGLALEFHVRRDALLPTVARVHVLRSDADTDTNTDADTDTHTDVNGELWLFPGCLLRPSEGAESTRWIADVWPFQVELDLEPADIARTYHYDPRVNLTASTLNINAWIRMPFLISGPGGANISLLDIPDVDVVEKRSGKALVEVAGDCMLGELWLDEDTLTTEHEPLIGRGSLCGGFGPDDYSASPGTVVFWPDGSRAGEVEPKHDLWLHRSASREFVGRMCFRINQYGQTAKCSKKAALEVCFTPESLSTLRDRDRRRSER